MSKSIMKVNMKIEYVLTASTRSIIVRSSPCPQHHFELQPQLHGDWLRCSREKERWSWWERWVRWGWEEENWLTWTQTASTFCSTFSPTFSIVSFKWPSPSCSGTLKLTFHFHNNTVWTGCEQGDCDKSVSLELVTGKEKKNTQTATVTRVRI